MRPTHTQSLPLCSCGSRHYPATRGDGRRTWCDGSDATQKPFSEDRFYDATEFVSYDRAQDDRAIGRACLAAWADPDMSGEDRQSIGTDKEEARQLSYRRGFEGFGR